MDEIKTEIKKETNQLYLLGGAFALFVLLIAGPYIYHLHSYPYSNKPSDWGALGDYFGGTLNPIISALTLFFVAKTYITQRVEIGRLAQANKEADARSERATIAQTEMAKNYLKQIEAVNRNALITTMTAKVDFSLKIVGIYHDEITRLVNANNSHKAFYAMDGESYAGEGMKKYRQNITDLIKREQSKINELIIQIDDISEP
ncbi:hypothetical protein AAH315_001143 [Enterobacter asburiae]|jgi:hypothetical protein|nr:hypothetical protein [Enterobacter asburiae]